MRVFLKTTKKEIFDEFTKRLERDHHEISEDGSYDMVIVNLDSDLPFSLEKLKEGLEYESVVNLIKAIKNYDKIIPVCTLEDYELVMEYMEKAGDLPLSERRKFSIKALFHLINYLSKYHIRFSELCGISEYELKLFKVLNSHFGNGYILEVLSEHPENVKGELLRPLLPIYLSTLSAIPKGSCVVFSKGVPVFASLKLEIPEYGDVLIYKGELMEKVNKFTIATSGKADVTYNASDEDELIYGSSHLSQKAIREFDGLEDIERLAVAVITISPVKSAFVFDERRMMHKEFFIERDPDINNLPCGHILAVNFEVEPFVCNRYKNIITTAGENIKKTCKVKVISRRF